MSDLRNSMSRSVDKLGNERPAPQVGGDQKDVDRAIFAPKNGIRITATWGSVVYLDTQTDLLRHGDPATAPANVAFIPDPQGDGWAGWLICEGPEGLRMAAPAADGGIALLGDIRNRGETRVVPLERGLVAIERDGRYLQAIPNGSIAWGATRASRWEFFLPSRRPPTTAPPITPAHSIDTRFLKHFIVDPRVRARSSSTEVRKPRILIYGYPKCSHGRVYYDLCKRLYEDGYTLDIINWRENHRAYIDSLKAAYDLFMTAPDGAALLGDAYGVPFERMIVVSHGEMDIRMLLERKGAEIFNRFAAYGVVSEFVYCASLMRGVRREPRVVALGINYDEFFMPPAEQLEAVGYASSMSLLTYGVELKRGYLAEAAAKKAGLPFLVAGSTGCQASFHDMREFYRGVGAILTSSISEAAGLPVMEAAAAGRLVIGTPVGHFPRKAYEGGGILAPVEGDKFVSFVAQQLRHYHDDPGAYRAKCLSIQQAARQFDWQYTIGGWVDLIEEAVKSVRMTP
ncbi:hypothetical protein K9U39_01070 [Rhodoblastus acidophilus]|uniref:Glycosyltransferase n=1 Tax=Candidatus Rhodoblastus alkanivorans TaxID=2954117 RepID=A0ABS9Z3J5_9HYPH|nr:hypothetical protein [Candidatus Rhodoblastus alkanivorans]MCI4680518.1 hypothetical protein [Candidatus Rhodoblastus alkanivorans]MCI4682244.1 hypothetical protein [Candidatus Rhodoblastus alkanivorans]MDI4639546.1 hypothetical protein [Rhodoblastus acidophilus]